MRGSTKRGRGRRPEDGSFGFFYWTEPCWLRVSGEAEDVRQCGYQGPGTVGVSPADSCKDIPADRWCDCGKDER